MQYRISDRVRKWPKFPGEFIIGQMVTPLADFLDESVLVEVRLGFGPLATQGTRLLRIPIAYLDAIGVGEWTPPPIPDPEKLPGYSDEANTVFARVRAKLKMTKE